MFFSSFKFFLLNSFLKIISTKAKKGGDIRPMNVSDTSVTLRKATEELHKLKMSYEASEMSKCEALLKSLKRLLIHLPTYLNPSAASARKAEELMISREVLEFGALVSAQLKDLESFETYFYQLQVYYSDVAPEDLPPSPRYMMIVGLNLVRLLVVSCIAQFHTELEKISQAANVNDDQYIRFAVTLERHLMEGSYMKLLNCRKQVPSSKYIPVVEMLEDTVRNEVALCIPRAYQVLSLTAAQRILLVPSTQRVLEIGSEQGWELSPDERSFVFSKEEDVTKSQIPFKEMMNHHIHFATDLQRIV